MLRCLSQLLLGVNTALERHNILQLDGLDLGGDALAFSTSALQNKNHVLNGEYQTYDFKISWASLIVRVSSKQRCLPLLICNLL